MPDNAPMIPLNLRKGRMEFKGIRIKVVAAGIAGAKGRGTLPAWTPVSKCPPNQEDGDASGVRAYYARALKRAQARGERLLVVPVAEGGVLSFVPSAKIMAQEIYRFLRGRGDRVLKEIRCVVPSKSDGIIFEKTLEGYLTHLAQVLTQGPFVTVDAIIGVGGGVVLVRRANPPFGWALPGGFVDYGETLEHAARREAKEETGLTVRNLRLFCVASDPGRDPRFHTISAVFTCRAKGMPRAASDAAAAAVMTPEQWRDLPFAFDHRKILDDYLRAVRRRCLPHLTT